MKYYRYPLDLGLKQFKLRVAGRILGIHNILSFIFFGLLLSLFLLFVMVAWFSVDLPTPGKLTAVEKFNSTKIYDKNDTLLFSLNPDYNRIYVNLSDIPQDLKEATIVAEDSEFYKNQGFSIRGYIRAVKDIILYRRMTGGSTITQQLVKNVLLTNERSVTRKIRELILAIQVEQRYSKDQILEMYLNDVPYGGTSIGVETASNLYFAKNVKDLTLSESVFLAGLPQSPTYYSPYTGANKAYVSRTEYVLRRLNEEGYISKQQKDKALEEVKNFKFVQKDTSIKAPHFVMYVRKQLVDMFGEQAVEKGNLRVITTLDYKLQEKNEEIVKEEIDKIINYNVRNAASLVLDVKNGAILSMVGNKDYFDVENDGNYNIAVSGERQPGSSLKPIVYAASFEKGYTPAALLMDLKTDFWTGHEVDKVYTPVNYDGKYRGPVQVRYSLGNSLNVPAVKLLAKIGVKAAMQKAYDMGIENWNPTQENMKNVGLSLVLGGRETTLLQVTSAYSVFAGSGIRKEPFAILEVRDDKDKVIYKHEDMQGKRVLSEEIAFLISHILLDSSAREAAFGTRSWLNVSGKTVSVKTGTTDEKKDNWTIGYTPSYVVGVWVGNFDNTPMNPSIASGVTGASPIWNKIITNLLKDKKDEQFSVPGNVIALQIDKAMGGLPVDGQDTRSEYFIKGTEPTTDSPMFKKIKTSKHQSDKLANPEEIKRNDYDLRECIVYSEQDSVSQDGKNRWQEAIDAWVKDTYKDDQKYNCPTQVSDHEYDQSSPTPTPTLTTISQTPTPTISVTTTPTPIVTIIPTLTSIPTL